MSEIRYLAFDFGLKKIGVAIGDSLLRHARPLSIIKAETRQQRFSQIEALLSEWQPDQVIVGLPLTLDGKEQEASVRARRFANQLHGRYGLEVTLVEEQNSSMEAQDLIRQFKQFDAKQARRFADDDDSVAAAVILQRHLDSLAS
ncbi:MAG: Holliday junction resolvase RuvX [Alcaligenaceae bacterium]|nr:Holliday junction resolvase RuvX [Alcaligenaceae bacterium]